MQITLRTRLQFGLAPLLSLLLTATRIGAVEFPQAADDQARVRRLEMLAELWGKVFLFHPTVATTDIDWNRVLSDAIPVEKAKNTDELVTALNATLFKPLNDPMSFAQKVDTGGEA